MSLRRVLLLAGKLAAGGVALLCVVTVLFYAILYFSMGPLPGEPLASDQRAFSACAQAHGALQRRTGALAFVGTQRPLAIRLPGETLSPAEVLHRFPDAEPALDGVRGAESVCTSFLVLPSYGSLSVVWAMDGRIGGMGEMGVGGDPVLRPFQFETDYIADDYREDTVHTQYWSSDAALLDDFDTTPTAEKARGEVLPTLWKEEAQAALAAPPYTHKSECNTRGFRFTTPLARVARTALRAIQRLKPVTAELATPDVVAPLVDVYAPSEHWDLQGAVEPDPSIEIVILQSGIGEKRRIPPVRMAPLDPDEQRMMMLPSGPVFLVQFRLEDFRHGDEIEFRYRSGRTKHREIYLNGVR
jgi:hypothetical protein